MTLRILFLIGMLVGMLAPVASQPDDCPNRVLHRFLKTDDGATANYFTILLTDNRRYNASWQQAWDDFLLHTPRCKTAIHWVLWQAFATQDLLLAQLYVDQAVQVPTIIYEGLESSFELTAITGDFVIPHLNRWIERTGGWSGASRLTDTSCPKWKARNWAESHENDILGDLQDATDAILDTREPDLQHFYQWRTFIAAHLVFCDEILEWSIEAIRWYFELQLLMTHVVLEAEVPPALIESIQAGPDRIDEAGATITALINTQADG